MRLYEVATKFADERHCIEHLVNMRWPNGVKCVYCKSDWVARYDSHGKTGKFRRVYECGDCHKQFTSQSGTLFHDSHLPLHKWFMAIALICESKKGMSAKQIQRALGISYKTAWYLAHRIREAMQDSNGLSFRHRGNRRNVHWWQENRSRRLRWQAQQDSSNRHERAWWRSAFHQNSRCKIQHSKRTH